MSDAVNRPSKIRQQLEKILNGRQLHLPPGAGEVVGVEKDQRAHVANADGWRLILKLTGTAAEGAPLCAVPLTTLAGGSKLLSSILEG